MKKQKVVIASVDSGSGHAVQLSKTMRKYANVTAVWQRPSLYGFDNIDPASKFGFFNIPPRADKLILVGCLTYDRLKNHLENDRDVRIDKFLKNFNEIVVIITDGGIMRRQNYYNNAFMDFTVFSTACKMQFREGLPTREYHQPFDLSWVPIEKRKKFTVGHSPYGPYKYQEKGTGRIINVVKNQGVELDLITGIKWRKAVRRKAKCHIFVDQIAHKVGNKYGWRGGIGKSGFEAMLLECLVISRGKYKGREMPVAPIAWCTFKTYANVLNYYINHHDERNEIIQKQLTWAKRYLDPNFHARRILGI